MSRRIRTYILATAAFTAFAAPALADSTLCTVTAPGIRLRLGPNNDAKVVSVLKKNTRVSAEGACGRGWVKVVSVDGRLSGYVAGWALAEATPQAAASSAAPATPETTTAKIAAPAVMEESPTNEQLAIEITNLRLDLLYLNREVEGVKKEVGKMKVTLAQNGRRRHLAASAGNAPKQRGKKS